MRNEPREAAGRISILQEERFCLVTADGRGLLFTLAHDANVGGPRLQRFLRENTPVRVAYSGEPGLNSAVAHTIRPFHAPAAELAP